jgi:putative ABC transport system permease protein
MTKLRRSHLRLRDALGVGSVGLRTRRSRTALTALGISIGIAALVAVMGISASSQADLEAELDALGTNRLTVAAGQSLVGGDAALPDDASAMIRRIGPVLGAASITNTGETVRRSEEISVDETGGMAVYAAETNLLETLGATIARGRYLDPASERYQTVVLGSDAATRLGVMSVLPQSTVVIGNERFDVIGVLDPVPLQSGLDNGVFIGYPVAADLFETERSASSIYVVTDPARVEAVRDVLAATANPEAPNEVDVSRPSDALAAREAVSESLTALLLGLGGVALLVGGIGIANTMVIAVLERRTEIGVRRALGATRRHIRLQFVIEAVLLSLLGGVLGVVIGSGVTAAYAQVQDIVLAIPVAAVAAGVGAALAVGALAGLSPAGRAAKLAPAEAIRPA